MIASAGNSTRMILYNSRVQSAFVRDKLKGRMDRVTTLCFFASYSLALALEVLYLRFGRPIVRALTLLAAGAGLVAQSIYLYLHKPPLIWPFSWLLFVAWILAVFYLCGAIHHRKQSWGVFVLPLVLGLLGLGMLFGKPPDGTRGLWQTEAQSPWAPIHAVLILLASVGVCVGFVASLMYLYQAHRLRTKARPGHGLRVLSLERLETMNRRAIVLAFPLLTAGMLTGVFLLLEGSGKVTWTDPRVLGTVILWLAFALLLYLRYGYHLRGRQVALMTIVTFLLLLCCLILSHPLPEGG
jgi:ABC-type transport system involved in cytochrome c biogenesis permease subunit